MNCRNISSIMQYKERYLFVHTKYFTERAEWGIQHRHGIKRGRVKNLFDTPSSLF